jgi:uncharacterized protein involved in exopolysaccharide biosynthesis
MNQIEQNKEQATHAPILDTLIVLARHKLLLAGIAACGALASAGVALMLPDIYVATTKVLPPQQTQSTSAVLAQLGTLAGLAGGAVPGLKNPNDLYVGMLKSRTVADNLIERFELSKIYDTKFQSDTRRRLAKATTMVAGKDGIITVEVEDSDPQLAAELANGYVDELFKLTKVLAVTEASQRRLFFERQMQQAKDNLATIEATARHALETGGLVQVEGQGRVMAETNARLRAEITVKEIQIGVMRAFATPNNPEVQRTQQQVEVMKKELARLEGTSTSKATTATEANNQGIGNLRLLREMKYHEATYELLAKQYEIAKIDEAKDSAIIQVMDKAIRPDKKSKPRRSVIVLVSTLIAGIVATICIIIFDSLDRSNPERAQRLAALRASLWKASKKS